jgi:arsenate reductase (thioredoxin)
VTTPSGVPIVVFVCVQNAGRSQIAEALFNRAAEGRAIARSAGSRPAEAVHSEVAAAMSDLGIDLSAVKPKALTPEVTEGVDWVVTMGCGDECPYIPGARRVDWEIGDPAGQSLNEVRGIIKHIKSQIDFLLPDVVVG